MLGSEDNTLMKSMTIRGGEESKCDFEGFLNQFRNHKDDMREKERALSRFLKRDDSLLLSRDSVFE